MSAASGDSVQITIHITIRADAYGKKRQGKRRGGKEAHKRGLTTATTNVSGSGSGSGLDYGDRGGNTRIAGWLFCQILTVPTAAIDYHVPVCVAESLYNLSDDALFSFRPNVSMFGSYLSLQSDSSGPATETTCWSRETLNPHCFPAIGSPEVAEDVVEERNR